MSFEFVISLRLKANLQSVEQENHISAVINVTLTESVVRQIAN